MIHSPDFPFKEGMEEAVAQNLEYEIGEQEENGAWSPTWSWGNQFPEVWPETKREWSGILTLEKLNTLKRFNRVVHL